jgi:hypothetical protein
MRSQKRRTSARRRHGDVLDDSSPFILHVKKEEPVRVVAAAAVAALDDVHEEENRPPAVIIKSENESNIINDKNINITNITNNTNNNNKTNKVMTMWRAKDDNQRLLGMAVLLTVPIVWGTYVPVVKVLYQVDPPIPGLVFSTAYFGVAAVASSFGLLLQQQQQQQLPVPSKQQDKEDESTTNTNSNIMAVRAGAELGLYLFVGNLLQVIGLKTVPADRAGFLVQSKLL